MYAAGTRADRVRQTGVTSRLYAVWCQHVQIKEEACL